MSHPAQATTLAQVLAPAAVEFPTLHRRYGALLELVRRLIGVVPELQSLPGNMADRVPQLQRDGSEPGEPAISPSGASAPQTPVGLAMYASSRAASCMYCSAHTASFGSFGEARPRAPVAERGRGAATESERAAVAVAEAISLVPARLTDAERDALLRSLSRGDAEWVVLAVAMMGFLNKTMDALSIELEAATVDEVGPLIGRSGWSAGRHRIVPTPGGAVPARADDLGLKLSLMRFLPLALALDRRWTAGVPSRWPAVGRYLSARTGHDFPVLRHLTHRRAVRAIATMLRDNAAPSRSHIGLDVKHRAGVVYATVVEDDGLAQEARILARRAGAGGDLDAIARFAAEPLDFDDDEAVERAEASHGPAMVLAKAASYSPARVSPRVVEGSRGACRPRGWWSSSPGSPFCGLLHRLASFYAPLAHARTQATTTLSRAHSV